MNKHTFKFTIKEMALIRTALELEAERCANFTNNDRATRAEDLAELFNRRIEDALRNQSSEQGEGEAK